MGRGVKGRLDKIEDLIVIDPKRRERFRSLTRQANAKRVHTVILMEDLLCTMESIFLPEEPSHKPEFVDRELNRPVSRKELNEIEDRPEESLLSDEKLLCKVTSILDGFCNGLRLNMAAGQELLPNDYTHTDWEPVQFIRRCEAVKNAMGVMTPGDLPE